MIANSQGPVVTGFVYIGVLALASTLLGLPFRAWPTFVIEARYGFNRTTPGTFAADFLRGGAIAVALGGLLLAVILAVFEWAGPLGWPWCWIAATFGWWTRNERTRTVAALPLEEILRDAVPVPAYQRLALVVATLRGKGWSDRSIAVEFGVTDKTIAKAIRWLPA